MLRTSDTEHVLSMIIHHSIYDGWPMGVLSRDLMFTYNCLSNGLLPSLQPLKLQYKDTMYLNYCYEKQYSDIHRYYWNSSKASSRKCSVCLASRFKRSCRTNLRQ
ncbi:hypothetical protein INP83_12135 [Mucilaginibacter sp. 21P]|uniref:condensation domain-containing protein n=1 Tax=Mucilaginibacter sp. 21P TaxID=2778902 RepID=UPI001C59A7A3|nr:hypothetical protein INP83_12135 [Mucilaginibacter sp. 21P]